MVVPAISTAHVATRGTSGTGVSQRSSSSTAPGIRATDRSAAPAARSGWAREVGDRAAERRGHGVEPREEEQVGDVEDVLGREPLAVDLGRDEARQQIVLRTGHGDRRSPLEVRVDLPAGLPGLGPALVEGLGLGPDDAVLEPRKRSRSSSGNPMSRRKTVHGNGMATAALNSQAPGVDELVESWLTSARTSTSSFATSRGLNSGSSRRRNFTWSGGIDLERDQRPDVADVDRVHVRGEHVRVAAAPT